ncbi:hypothetical protein Rrhod_0317 [Rhodococcus rhodnii LMG 5362]|uniref:Uncharacterized protein n=1 Tax=Rhodococcus rhodnii LMG 5362 TaxID=1273125 RepID=R7WSS9_9NOCA|nr:hypothetical protein Rrhod_0317 [Rhodococcus rhodnii LMG 5362]
MPAMLQAVNRESELLDAAPERRSDGGRNENAKTEALPAASDTVEAEIEDVEYAETEDDTPAEANRRESEPSRR